MLRMTGPVLFLISLLANGCGGHSEAAPAAAPSVAAVASGAVHAGQAAASAAQPAAAPNRRVAAKRRVAALQVGAGIYDVTGPAGDATFMGYVKLSQRSRGIHTRLWSRAFVIASPDASKRVALVSVDLGMICQAVTLAVVERLKRRFGGLYTHRNVILSATHTHSAPGGYSGYLLYNAVSGGFDQQNFDAVVDGITKSIERAHANLAPGRIKIARGELVGASMNRSPPAYRKNPAAERGRYRHAVDTTMTLLRFEDSSGRELGTINWFPVHTTNVGNQNTLISSDNKGYASVLFERAKGSDYGPRAFVAAFAQANEGDSSPNLWGHPDLTHDYQRMQTIGQKQLDKARALYRSASTELAATLDHRQTSVNFARRPVAARWTGGAGPQQLGRAALGIVKVAGAPADGQGLGFVPQGVVYGQNWPRITLVPRDQAEHAEKVILLVMGMFRTPLTPEVLPLHLVRIGSLAVVAVPFEMTTMTGRRLRAVVRRELAAQGVRHVVLAGLANAYAGYVTTREEYSAQHYEGSSTHFGPWMAAAIRQEVHALAAALKQGRAVAPGPTPRVVTRPNRHRAPRFDRVPRGASFGGLVRDAAASYRSGQTARAVFWTGHPRHDLKPMSTYLEVQRQTSTGWRTVFRDNDPETRFRWSPQRLRRSQATVEWDIPAGATPGVYRLVHHGSRKARGGKIHAVRGESRSFTVSP